jgi:sulfur carrier protein ThiS
MKVNVVFFGDFARFKPAEWTGRRGAVEVPEGATVDVLAERLGIGEEPFVVMLNEEQHHRGAQLHEGDTVTFLPPLAGGAGRPPPPPEPPPDEPEEIGLEEVQRAAQRRAHAGG